MGHWQGERIRRDALLRRVCLRAVRLLLGPQLHVVHQRCPVRGLRLLLLLRLFSPVVDQSQLLSCRGWCLVLHLRF